MNPWALRVLYEVLAATGLNPALAAADVPDARLMELWKVPIHCGPAVGWTQVAEPVVTPSIWHATAGTRSASTCWAAIDKARSRAVGAAASARFIQGDVTRLSDLGIGDGYDLIVDSGCYYGLSGQQRDAYAVGVTQVAAPDALLLHSCGIRFQRCRPYHPQTCGKASNASTRPSNAG
jgi:hypothetical protein